MLRPDPTRALRRLSLLLPTLGALVLASTSCVAPYVGAGVRYQCLSLDSDFAASSGSTVATTSSTELGMTDSSHSFLPVVTLGWAGSHIKLSATDANYEGSGTLSSEIDLGGVTLPVSEPVDSTLDLKMYTATYVFDLVPTGKAMFAIGPGVSVVDFQTSITSTSTSETAATDETLPLPFLALRGEVDLGKFELAGDVGWIDIKYQGDQLQFLDLDLAARYVFTSTAGRAKGAVELGYRNIDLMLDYDDEDSSVFLDAQLDGPYVSVTFRL